MASARRSTSWNSLVTRIDPDRRKRSSAAGSAPSQVERPGPAIFVVQQRVPAAQIGQRRYPPRLRGRDELSPARVPAGVRGGMTHRGPARFRRAHCVPRLSSRALRPSTVVPRTAVPRTAAHLSTVPRSALGPSPSPRSARVSSCAPPQRRLDSHRLPRSANERLGAPVPGNHSGQLLAPARSRARSRE